MRIGIAGAGHIGGTLAGLFVSAGHEVAVGNSRDAGTLAEGGRRHQVGAAVYGADLTTAELRAALR
jgi:predicted dinucleotide-binding enzyme